MNELFDSRSAIAASTTFDAARPKLRPPLPSPEELQAQRLKAVAKGFVYRKGANGVTVFKGFL